LEEITASEAIIKILRNEKIKYVFGNPGTTETAILDELSDTKAIQFIITLHENIAMGMADGFSRLL